MQFLTIVVTLFVFCGSLNVKSSPVSSLQSLKVDQAILRYMMQPNSLIRKSNVLECSAHYTPIMEASLKKYEEDASACQTSQTEQLEALKDEDDDERQKQTNSLSEVCTSLKGCTEESENLPFFDCVNKSGGKSTSQIWTTSQDALETAAKIRNKVREIRFETDKCMNETERVYVIETAKTVEEMTDCFNNGLKVVTPPPTEAPSTDDPSTEAPSTEEPSTEDPSTEAPSTEEPSTEAPSTEAPSTEAPSTEAPSTDDPSTEAPSTEEPSTEDPSTEAPSTEEPSTEAPSTEAPSSEASSTDEPSTEAPSTDEPPTEASSTEAPSTEEPSTEAPSIPSTEASEEEPMEELSEEAINKRIANIMKGWGRITA